MAKMTKRDALVDILALVEGDADLAGFVTHEIELLDKRASAGRKPTPAQRENESLKSTIVSDLAEVDEGRTATDIANGMGISVQKASQLLRQLTAEGLVTRTPGKGKTKTVFSV